MQGGASPLALWALVVSLGVLRGCAQDAAGPVVLLTTEKPATNDVLRVHVSATDDSPPLAWSINAAQFIVEGAGRTTLRGLTQEGQVSGPETFLSNDNGRSPCLSPITHATIVLCRGLYLSRSRMRMACTLCRCPPGWLRTRWETRTVPQISFPLFMVCFTVQPSRLHPSQRCLVFAGMAPNHQSNRHHGARRHCVHRFAWLSEFQRPHGKR